MTEAQVIALDVGGASVKSAIVAPARRIVGQPIVTPIDSSADAETILTTFADIIQRHLAHVDPASLIGVAFGFRRVASFHSAHQTPTDRPPLPHASRQPLL